MVPVYIARNGQISDSFEDFTNEFLTICRSHQKQGRALAFAFILYDFDHPEIRKILRDKEYWDALDHISGTTLTIFSFHIDESRRGRRALRSGLTFTGSQEFLDQRFHVELLKDKPSLLFFQVTGEEVSTPCLIEVRATTVEGAFNEIRAILLDVVNSLRGIQPEFRRNTKEIFTQLEQTINQRKFLLKVKKVASLAGATADLVGKLKP